MGKSYLEGPFERELNYKLWSTKGARFIASRRLNVRSKLSLWAMAAFSSYLIIFSLLAAMFDLSVLGVSSQVVSFVNIVLALLVFVVSQEINRNRYNWRSTNYHKCSLEIARLYNQLRICKSKNEGSVADSEIESISVACQDILDKYENHEQIDYDFFRASRSDYKDHEIGFFFGMWYRIRYVWATYAAYSISMLFPGIALVWLIATIFRSVE